jgi:hypothetical protein
MERWGAEAKVTGIYFGVPVAVPVAAAPAHPTSSRNAHMARRKLGTFPNLTLRPEKPALINCLGPGYLRRHRKFTFRTPRPAAVKISPTVCEGEAPRPGRNFFTPEETSPRLFLAVASRATYPRPFKYDPSFEAPKPSGYRNACSAGVVSRLSARFRWGNRPESLNNVSMLRRVAQLLGLT